MEELNKLKIIHNDFTEFLEYTRGFLYQSYLKIDEPVYSLYKYVEELSENIKNLETNVETLKKENVEIKKENVEIKEENEKLKEENTFLKTEIINNKIKDEESTNLIIKLDEKISQLREENRLLFSQIQKKTE